MTPARHLYDLALALGCADDLAELLANRGTIPGTDKPGRAQKEVEEQWHGKHRAAHARESAYAAPIEAGSDGKLSGIRRQASELRARFLVREKQRRGSGGSATE